ncbi:hypothetical protein AAG906_033307 [Vitis piasezkii]
MESTYIIPQFFVVVLFVRNLYVIKEMKYEMFCYIHEGGELANTCCWNISHFEFVSKVCGELNLEPNSIKLDFTVKFDPSCLLPLHDDADIVKMFKFNDMFCRAYVFQCTEGGDGFIGPTSNFFPCLFSQCPNTYCCFKLDSCFLHWQASLHKSNESPTIESFRFSQRCAETNIIQLQPSRFQHSIIAWKMKEKAKECIYGLPKNYYKLLPWMCERMLATNPGLSVELSYSNYGYFEQLFIAHSISIQGFVTGCQPIIAIDSAHMSGPNDGALFSATAYNANDSMFPLAFGVMSSKNYEDWLWFLEKLKIVVGNKEIIIILDRLFALLRSVLEVFGLENHAYCYRHRRRILVISCPSITHEGTRAKKMHFNS